MNDIRVVEESTSVLSDYGKIPIAFEVSSVFEVKVLDHGLGGIRLTEHRLDRPRWKDYDSYENEGPGRWAKQWDLSNWQVLSAYIGTARVAGGVVAWNTPGVHMLEGRDDIGVLWDLRVAPAHRRRGIGGELIEAAAAWASNRGCRMLKVETQNVNVPACRLYANHGFILRTIVPGAYPELPDEVQLIWCRDLA